jgi:microcystin degradation protein MlrC
MILAPAGLDLGSPCREGLLRTMPRIVIAECRQEVSTFNPAISHYEDFTVASGKQILAEQCGSSMELGGAFAVFDARSDLTLVTTTSHRAITSGGPLAAASWERIEREWEAGLVSAAEAGEIDGAYFCMHGAMMAENELDPEGALLTIARRILGERIPIVASLDLHGIVTDRMLRLIDAAVPYHTYPHVDFYETGERAAKLLLRLLDGAARPQMAYTVVPTLVRGDELITETGLFGEIVRDAAAIESGPGGYSAGMFIGNPFTDVPELASGALVITDDSERSAAESARLAARLWEVRARLQAPLVALDQMVARVKAAAGPVLLSDAADATSSGASGDSNAIVRALLDGGYHGRILAPIVDAPAAAAAFSAGVGAKVRVPVGGAVDAGRFMPMPLDARVRRLSDGEFISESHGTVWNSGPTAVLEAGSLTLIVTSRPVSLYDRSLFFAHGQNPARFDAVVVKSPHIQHRFYADWATDVINVDAPGSTSANLPSLGHTRCARPMYPMELDTEFRPETRVYARS